MHDFILNLSLHHSIWVYLFIVVIAMLEGPYLSLFLGGFLFAGYFSLLPVYFSLMLGDLIGDVIWYFAGHRYGHRFVTRFGHKFNLTESHVEKMKSLFHERKDYVLFLSKITNGFGLAIVVLFTAGLSRIPFKRYLTINLLGQFIWSGLLLIVGYSFSNLYTQITSWAGKISLVIFALCLLFILFRYAKSVNKKLKLD